MESGLKSKYLKRLKKVNDMKDKTVFDCIDKPMRRICFEMNRIGFQTHFSCCGFEYENQEEPKTHIHSKNGGIYAYVLFSVLSNEQACVNLANLRKFCKTNEFVKIKLQNLNPILNLVVCPDKVGFAYCSKDLDLSIHDYEFIIVGVESVALFLQDNIPTVNDPVVFKDGNALWNVENWQVKPKPDYEISVEKFYETYGKLKTLNYLSGPDFARFNIMDSEYDDLTCVNPDIKLEHHGDHIRVVSNKD